jgi:hypothetical protein
MLGYTVCFRTPDPALDDYLDRLFGAFPAADRAEHEYVITPDGSGEQYRLESNDDAFGQGRHPESLVANVVTHVNRSAAAAAEHVLVHAGGVERDGAAVMLPANMERGKTTLTTGLVRAGFRYVSDEAVAIRRDTLDVVPYPKPMSLDPGSWALFPEYEPHEPFGSDDYKATQWQVSPAAIRPDAVAGPCRVRFVVFPDYDEDSTTELVPLSRAEALVELTKNTFRFDQEGRPTLDVLAAVIREAECYRLPNNSLDAAVACIIGLTGTLRSP